MKEDKTMKVTFSDWMHLMHDGHIEGDWNLLSCGDGESGKFVKNSNLSAERPDCESMNGIGHVLSFRANKVLLQAICSLKCDELGFPYVAITNKDLMVIKKLGIRSFWCIIDQQRLQYQAEEASGCSFHSNKPTHLYMMRDGHTGFTKIGRSINPSSREKTLQAQIPMLEMIWSEEGVNSDEQNLHEIFKSQRLRGEWFDLSGSDVKFIKSLDWRK